MGADSGTCVEGVDVVGVLDQLGVSGEVEGLWRRCGMERLDDSVKAGWKVHVSGGPGNFLEILGRVVPILEEAGCAYKTVASLDVLEALNDGEYGLMQVGKAMTVYFVEEEEGARVTGLLAEALSGYGGPIPASDFQYAAGAPVSFRFGPFDGRYGVDLLGQKQRLVRHPAVGDVVDVTSGGEVVGPLCNHFPRRDLPDHTAFLRDDYVLLRMLHLSAKGGVFVGVAKAGEGRVPLLFKTARQGAHLDKFGRDAVWALEREHGLLEKLGDLGCLPEAGALLRSESGDVALVRPFVAGDTFWDLWTKADGASASGREELSRVLDKVALALEGLHGAGVVLRDLSPGNIVVDEQGEVCFLDLELAHEVGSEEAPYRRGTRGFYDETKERWSVPEPGDDLYALSQLRRMVDGVPVSVLRMTLGEAKKKGKGKAPYRRGTRGFYDETKERWSVPEPGDDLYALSQLRRMVDGVPVSVLRMTLGEAKKKGKGKAVADDVFLQQRFEEYLKAWFAVEWPVGPADPDRFNVYSGMAGMILQGLEWSESGLLDCMPYSSLDRILVGLDDASHQVYQIPGLYFGASGIAVALIGLGRALDDDMVERRGRRLLGQLSRAPHPSPDICQGTGGYLAACITAEALTGDACYKHWALHAAHDLLHRAEVHPEGWLWFWREGPFGSLSGMRGYGFGHGLSGIVHTLLRAHALLGDEALWCGALRGLWMVHERARQVGDSGGVWWSPDERDTTVWNGWCHGTPGVVKGLARAYRAVGRVEERVLLEQALEGVASANNSELCLCHGVASRVDAYLDARAALGTDFPDRFRGALDQDVGLLMDVVRRSDWGDELDAVRGAGAGSGLMTGYGGLLRVLLRYHGGLGREAGEVLP